jgi:hypothetical protein
MQLIETNAHAYQCHGLQGKQPADYATEVSPIVSNRLLVLLSSSLVAVTGPAILGAITQASLAAIQLLLEIGRVGLVAYQILGR